MEAVVKQELLNDVPHSSPRRKGAISAVPPDSVIALDTSSSDSDSDSDSDSEEENGKDDAVLGRVLKKRRLNEMGVIMPVLDPLPSREEEEEELPRMLPAPAVSGAGRGMLSVNYCKQFWKAGEFEVVPCGDADSSAGGMDHVRIHPKFLHSNATSHKWALGAFAELLDNAIDEVCTGATYVKVDMLENQKDGSRILLIEDNGGGMNPDKIRDCMSLGFSTKSKIANTIGQYGNGFKTSTMRLGADVIVFSRCCGKDGKSATQSIGLLSYTFLRSTGKEDTVVPMLDYERQGADWYRMRRSSPSDWNKNLETILEWSPFSREEDLDHQFYQMKNQGTRVIIYNLWEDDEGQLELDFDADPHDIQIRGVNRDEKNIQMAKQFPNSRHFLTYRHSLRSYAAILYLRLPIDFRIILRGKDVEHHNIVNDMMMSQKVTYKPQPSTADGIPKDANMAATVTIGFVKDAKHHIDVQGFNVYHKNRLIKPFWRLWNAAGSDGRGVIGLLEANFVEPAHDKQGFERTTILSRLEAKLVQMQKTYWSTNCHKIGYAARRNKKVNNAEDKETSPDFLSERDGTTSGVKRPRSLSDTFRSKTADNGHGNIHVSGKGKSTVQIQTKLTPTRSGEESSSSEASLPLPANVRGGNVHKQVNGGRESLPSPANVRGGNVHKQVNGGRESLPSPANVRGGNVHKQVNGGRESRDKDIHVAVCDKQVNGSFHKSFTAMHYSGKDGPAVTELSSDMDDTESQQECTPCRGTSLSATKSKSKGNDFNLEDLSIVQRLRKENHELKEKLKKQDEQAPAELLKDLMLEREKNITLETKLKEAEKQIEFLNKEQDSLIDIFTDERQRRDDEENKLRKKLQDASNTIQELVEKVRELERRKPPKMER
ncbi:protein MICRORCHIDIA 7-like [Rosa rugosa]|uniref:protein MICRORCHIDIA 7-like n=1 Tax=Rosa rugosa TaxID=74645 RepID=UPI002B41677F|nr:protein MICRORCHIDIA 7-like [Rosa rugosa]